MLEAVQEIAIYVHRFHNLDLFQQGWYQIKITMRWEDDTYTSPGIPARVVQYEAPDGGLDNALGVWRIDDTDNSFYTQPFRIKYARQDVLLSVMISFNLSLEKCEVPATSAVILKFELLFSPILENGFDMQASLDAFPAAVHEFQIPPKALLGLHSYCPVHFDYFHAVLVDLSVHIVLLKAGAHGPRQKVPSDSQSVGDIAGVNCDGSNQVSGQRDSTYSNQIAFLKALLVARDILLDELEKLNKAIDQTIDLTHLTSILGDNKFIGTNLRADLHNTGAEDLRKGARLVASKSKNGFQNGTTDEVLQSQSLFKENLLCTFNSLGSQVSFLWNTFLNFHRVNKTKIVEYLRDAWANDQKAEWAIWMVFSKVETPHCYMRSGEDETSQGVRGKFSRKLSDDPVEIANARAELHRRSIAQMTIDNKLIKDMNIFGDPLRIPVITVERVMNSPLHSTSGNSYFSHTDQEDASNILMGPVNKQSDASCQRNGRVLRVVVFVHGFQACLLLWEIGFNLCF
ncbi:PREDICTED: uncharacterized protein LOC104599909 isoform X2 [Nelumbo nucifera]|uniref:Uncharacterized protein LOC104599909 isoform X2 n=1 Tax=Nelumbo nucifera TaxID=4432 RepID=A0A1U8Q6U4_NELNU|nr:PREDICTED: uncharacterized protein LOC104599909 isoform X2 [Nelumbo nucifera]